MTFKMAAPWRQTMEIPRSLAKLCRRQTQMQFLSTVSCDNGKVSSAFPVSSNRKGCQWSSCRMCIKNCNSLKSFSDSLRGRSHPSISTSCQRLYCSSSIENRKCWKCGSETNKKEELFFCNCGMVQEVPDDLNYFRAMGFEETFDLDLEKLSRLYKDLQRRLHPDKYSRKSEEEQSVAIKQSAYINKAYTTLLRPLSRSLYILELHGDPIDESNTSVDPEFLMLMMEINEELSESQHDVNVVKVIEERNLECLNKCVKSISEAFKNNNITEAKAHVIKLKYYTNIEDKIKEIHRHKMDRWTL